MRYHWNVVSDGRILMTQLIPSILGTKLWEVEGGEDSVAAQLYYRIVTSTKVYEYNTFYRLCPGPNSNSYIAWCLAPYPDLLSTLPFAAFGKNFTKNL